MKTLLLFGAIALSINAFGQVPAYVPTNGLIAWHPFNGNADEFISGLTPTSNNAVLTTDRYGNPNSAYHFDGSQVITYNGLHPFGALGNNFSDFTINFWLNDAENLNPTNGWVLGSFGWGYHIQVNNTNIRLDYVIDNLGTWENHWSSANIHSDCWKMLTFTKNGATMDIYIDGVLDTTMTVVPVDNFTSSNNFIGGNAVSQNGYYKGIIDDIGLWNIALTPNQITQLYNNFVVPPPVYAGMNQSICNGDPITLSGSGGVIYNWDNNVLDGVQFNPLSTSTYILNGINNIGCVSSDTVEIIVNQNTSGEDIITACDTYDWIDGNTYTSDNNTATWTETNAAGCDSIVTLDLTITNSNTGTDVQAACDSYTWIDGNTYTSSNNTATWTETNVAGCDSVVTLELTITPLPDNNVTQAGSLLTADQAGAAYVWLDCNDNNAIINGETNQSYTPTPITGNYAVEVTLNGCVDTSACFLVDYTGLSDLYAEIISIHPNPTSDVLSISGLNEISGLKGIEITSSKGEVVMKINGTNEEINVYLLPAGVYFLNIKHEQGVETIRFIKQ